MTMRSIALRSLVLATFGAILGACWVEPDPQQMPSAPAPTNPVPTTTAPDKTPPTEPARVGIATGETMMADAGKGAGVFVEYHGEGKWRVWSTCDTPRTGLPCNYRLTMTAESGARFQAPTMDPAGANDNRFDAIETNRLAVAFTTTSEVDAVDFRVEPPGSALELEALLDNQADSRIIFWVGPEVLHTGAPTNPVIFDPTKP